MNDAAVDRLSPVEGSRSQYKDRRFIARIEDDIEGEMARRDM